MVKYQLSKSTFIRGLQCEKSLYLYKKHYNLKDPTSPFLQAIFDQGNSVGILAQSLFPGGADASPESHFKVYDSVGKTKSFLDQGEKIIYEATFFHDGVIVALDVLVKDSQGWKAYEVKSSTSVSETYVKDAAIQYFTIVNSGIYLKDISIVYINNQYVREEKLKIDELFTVESVKDRVLEYLPVIPNEVSRLKRVIEKTSAPDVEIGIHCSKPYPCDFKGTCWKNIPEYSVFNIANLNTKKKFDLYNKGIVTLDQIELSESQLSPNQILQVQSEIDGTSYIDQDQIKKFTNSLRYPVYYLDFETIGPSIPVFEGSKPYQQLVFQYSLHIQEVSGSKVIHKEYLADPKEDPRIKFTEQLISDCGVSGDILVYNISFEKGKLQDLIETFPNYSVQLQNIISRLKDLMVPFQKKWFYTPEMRGSYSIKQVLPALVPELSYNDLEINEGGNASNTFLSMVNGTFKGNELQVRKNLLEYCKMDTYAMVKILEKLLTPL